MGENGESFFREFGKFTDWLRMRALEKKRRLFVPNKNFFSRAEPTIFRLRQELFRHFLVDKDMQSPHLKSIIFGTDTPGGIKLAADRYCDAFFHNSQLPPGTEVNRLDNGPEKCIIGTNVEKFPESLLPLIDLLATLGFPNLDMCVVRRSEPGTSITCFRKHKDKKIFDTGVAFVPLKEYFWTVIEGHLDGNDDMDEFNTWLSKIGALDRRKVNHFMKQFSKKRGVYKCIPGSVLAFAAADLEHGTIIPATFEERQVCIFSKLVSR